MGEVFRAGCIMQLISYGDESFTTQRASVVLVWGFGANQSAEVVVEPRRAPRSYGTWPTLASRRSEVDDEAHILSPIVRSQGAVGRGFASVRLASPCRPKIKAY